MPRVPRWWSRMATRRLASHRSELQEWPALSPLPLYSSKMVLGMGWRHDRCSTRGSDPVMGATLLVPCPGVAAWLSLQVEITQD